MKVVVLGAGALGSIIAGHLARAGEDVILVARGDRAEYLKKNGITITGLVEFNVACPIVTDPRELKDANVLIVTVKTHDLEEAISSFAEVKFTSVITVLNGVHINQRLAEAFGTANAVGSSAYFSGETLPSGSVRFTVNDGFFIGELPEGVSDRTQDLSSMMQNSGITSESVANIQTLQWSKFTVWVAASAVSILTRLATYRFMQDPGSALVCARVGREIAAIADRSGITVEDIGSFPVKAMVNGSEEEAVSTLQELGAFFEANAPEHRLSMLQDLDRGRRLEIDETFGYVVAEARRLDIPAPTLQLCYSLCKAINQNL